MDQVKTLSDAEYNDARGDCQLPRSAPTYSSLTIRTKK